MKLLERIKRTKNRRGIAMTEYLIILAIIAVSAIAVVGLFGQQIKSAFIRNSARMRGEAGTVNTEEVGKSGVDTKANDMGNFDK